MSISNDDELRITTSVDLAGLKAGMDSGAVLTEVATQRMQRSFSDARSSVTTSLKNMQQAQQEFGAAAAAGNAQAQAVLAQYTTELRNAEEESARYKLALDQLRNSQDQLNVTQTRYGIQLAAQEAGIGRIPRALQGVIANSELAQKAIGAAFGGIVLIGFGEIIVRIGEKIAGLVREFNAVLNIEDQLAPKLGPLEQKLAAIYERTRKLHEEIVGLEQGKIAEDQMKAADATDKVVTLVGRQLEIQRAINELVKQRQQSESDNIDKDVARMEAMAGGIGAAIGANQPKTFDFDAWAKQISDLEGRLRVVNAEIQEAMTEADKGSAQAAKTARDEWTRAAKKTQEEFTKLKRIIDEIALSQQKAASSLDSKQNDATLKVFEEQQRAKEEANRQEIASNKRVVDAYLVGLQEQQDAAKATYQQRVAMINEEYQTHQINLKQRTAAILEALRQEVEAERRALQDRLDILALDPENPQKVEEAKRQLLALEQKYQTEKLQIITKATVEQQQTAMKAFDQVGQSIRTSMNGWLQGTQSFRQAVSKIWAGIALDAIGQVEKIAFKWIEQHILMRAYNAIFHAQQQAEDAAALAAKQSMTSAANVATATSDAAVAADATFAWYSAIDPPIAPAMAAEAHGIGMSFAGLAAFAQGTTYVPRTGMAMLHEGEAVLTQPNAQQMRDFLNGGGQGNSPITINVPVNVNAIDGKSFTDTLLDNLSTTVAKKVAIKLKGYTVG